MGFKEGWNEGSRIAEKIFVISSEFEHAKDPRMDARLAQCGITPQDQKKLSIKPTLKPEQIGQTMAGLYFILRHGTIWNSKDMHSR